MENKRTRGTQSRGSLLAIRLLLRGLSTSVLWLGMGASMLYADEKRSVETPSESSIDAMSGEVVAIKNEGSVVPENAPHWISDSKTGIDHNQLEFPVRLTSESLVRTTDNDYVRDLMAEVKLSIDEMKIFRSPVRKLFTTFNRTKSDETAFANWINPMCQFNSSSNLGGVELHHHWRLVQIDRRDLSKLKEIDAKLVSEEEARKKLRQSFVAIMGVSVLCAVLGQILRKKS